jgi:hypothetical protein
MTYIGPARYTGIRQFGALIGAAFVPTDIAGLLAWYKADSLALNDNDAVSSWADSGGSLGLAATQATSGNRPVYKTNIQNGLPVVRFDGTDDYLQTATFGSDQAQPTTWFVVTKNTATDSTQRHVIDGSHATGTKRQAIGRRNSSGNKWFVWAATFLLNGADDTNWNIFTAILNGASSSHQVNAATAANGNAGTQVLNGITIGANNVSPFSNCWTGDVGEVLLYSGSLSSGDQTSVRNYLNGRWAVY